MRADERRRVMLMKGMMVSGSILYKSKRMVRGASGDVKRASCTAKRMGAVRKGARPSWLNRVG